MDSYLLLAKGQRGLALVDLIQKVTADPAVFAFGELLDVQSVKDLGATQHASSVDLLKLFCRGVWSEYKEHAGELPALNGAQQAKLKQLTVVLIAASSKVVPYKQLMAAVDVDTIRELEDLLISHCFYPRLISGSLDQRQACLQVEETVGRDIPSDALPEVRKGLDTWLLQSKAMLQQLEDRIHGIETATEQANSRRTAEAVAVDEARANLSKNLEQNQATMVFDEETAAAEDRGPPPGVSFPSRSKRRR